MRGVRGIAEQDDLVVRPAIGDDPPEIEPGLRPRQMRGVGHQRIAVEIFREDILADGDRFRLIHPVEAECRPDIGIHLDDEGREIVIEAIGVRPDPAGFDLFEGEGEGVEGLVRAEPEEFVAADLDVDVEMLGIGVADAAVGAVRRDDEVIIGPVGEIGARLMLEMQVHAELAGTFLQDREQALAADADKTMAGGADTFAMDMDVDIVPMREFVADGGATDGIVRHQILDGLVREDDPPAERIVGPVAFEQVDLMAGIAQLHRNREIEAGRTTTETRDLHDIDLHCSSYDADPMPIAKSFKLKISSLKHFGVRRWSRHGAPDGAWIGGCAEQRELPANQWFQIVMNAIEQADHQFEFLGWQAGDKMLINWCGDPPGIAQLVEAVLRQRHKRDPCILRAARRRDQASRSHALDDARHGGQVDDRSLRDLSRAAWAAFPQDHQHPPGRDVEPDRAQPRFDNAVITADQPIEQIKGIALNLEGRATGIARPERVHALFLHEDRCRASIAQPQSGQSERGARSRRNG